MLSNFFFRLFRNQAWYKRWQAKRSRARIEKENRLRYGADYEECEVIETGSLSPELQDSIKTKERQIEEARSKQEDVLGFRNATWKKIMSGNSLPLTDKDWEELERKVDAEVASYTNERYPEKS